MTIIYCMFCTVQYKSHTCAFNVRYPRTQYRNWNNFPKNSVRTECCSASRTTTVYRDRQLRMSWVCQCVCVCVMSVCVSVHRNRSGGSRNQTVTCADAAADCFDLKSGQTMMRFQNHEVDTVTHFHHWRCRRCSSRHNKLTRRTWGGAPSFCHNIVVK